jgi:uncharacterized protein (DUF2141 family)
MNRLFTKKKSFKLLLFLALIAFACWQCANPIAPTGGPKDEQPPRIDSARSTPNLQTNFRPKRIELTFDEWIKLEQANQQVVISPPLQGYEVTLKGKRVILDFGDQDTLRSNVTYVVQFGNAVKDLTESNPAENLRFVFSTGPYIDSLEIQGQVLDAYTSEPVEGALVMLYDNLADSVFRTQRPFYFGRTDQQGLFLISNLRAGTYKLVALKDSDANYRYNQPSETIAFFPQPLIISADSIPPISLRMFQEALPLQIADVDSSQWGRLKMLFNRLPQGDLELLTDEPYLRTLDRDSLLLWHRAERPWTLYVNSDTLLADTLRIPAAPVAAAARSLAPLVLKKLDGEPDQSPQGQPIHLGFNLPVERLDTTLVRLQQDTLEEKIPFRWEKDSVEHRRFLLRQPWQSGAKYQLTLYPGAVTDYWERSNTDTLTKSWTGGDPNRLGNLLLTFITTDTSRHYYVRLLLKSKPPLATFSLHGETSTLRTFKALTPGDYLLEIIEDTNVNQRWDTGSYTDERQAERVVIRPLEALRANWNLEATIDLADLFP